MPDVPLERLQSWMQAVITHPGSVEEAVVSPPADSLDPEGVIRTTRGMSPCERLEIYHGMYPLRMREALGSDYPMLLELVGEHDFGHLVDDYIAVYPSRSYTLNRLGDSLPGFVASWGPARGRALRRDIALLELALTEVFDAPEREPLGADALAAVNVERWGEVRLEAIPALRLLRLRTPAGRAFDALKAGEGVPSVRGVERLVVYREGFAVRRRELPSPAFRLLSLLVGGASLGDAVAGLAGTGVPAGDVTRWTSGWVSDGLFCSVSA